MSSAAIQENFRSSFYKRSMIRASCPPIANASQSSKSLLKTRTKFLRGIDFAPPGDSHDWIDDLKLKPLQAGDQFSRLHDDVKDLLHSWLSENFNRTKVRIMVDGSPKPYSVSAKTEESLPFNTHEPCKRADVVLCGDCDIPYVQFEIQSNKPKSDESEVEGTGKESGESTKRRKADTSREDTIAKLGYGLVDQLIYLRNKTDLTMLGNGELIQSLSGFYVPIEGPIEKITCTWNDDKLMFVVKRLVVPSGAISVSLKDAISHVAHVCRTKKEASNFMFPLDRHSSFLKEIGDGSFQVMSGASIVIVNRQKDKVYKHPFDGDDIDNLFYLTGKISPSICFPTEHKELNFIEFFKFPLLKPHKTYEDFRNDDDLSDFIRTTSRAVQELHEKMKLAHLDIRIDNVCFGPDNTAVLIDLDRSRPVDTLVDDLLRYGDSAMYTTPTTSAESWWKAENLDWKQVAIMVYAIQKRVTSTEEYHQISIPQPTTEDGVLSKQLHLMFTNGLAPHALLQDDSEDS